MKTLLIIILVALLVTAFPACTTTWEERGDIRRLRKAMREEQESWDYWEARVRLELSR